MSTGAIIGFVFGAIVMLLGDSMNSGSRNGTVRDATAAGLGVLFDMIVNGLIYAVVGLGMTRPTALRRK